MTATLAPPVNVAAPAAPPRGRRGPQLLLMRLHFYAGVLVGPFLAVAALTGLLFTLAPQISELAYGDALHAGQAAFAPRPVAEQLAAAQASQPGLEVSSVRIGEGDETTRVVFADPSLTDDRERTVYVDPWSGRVRGSLTTWFGSTPAVTWLDDLHRNLLLGDAGRHYSEIAASWLWVVALGGVVLWLKRRRDSRRLRRLLLPELSARGRRRVLSWHGTTGLALIVGLLFLSMTGLTWSRFAGANFTAALEGAHATAPVLDTVLPGGVAASVDLADADRVLTAARSADLSGPVVLTPPADGGAWSVAQDDSRWPIRLDQVAVDGQSGAVTAANPWSDRSPLSKLSSLGISAHMGILFGPVNQVLLAAVALGLLCVLFWGYRAWWLRRPTKSPHPGRFMGRAPQRGTWREVHPAALVAGSAVTAFLCWAMPLLGVTLVGFLAIDAVLHAVRRQAVAAARLPAPAGRVQAEDEAEELLA